MKELVCICCPVGCILCATVKDGVISVTGNSCPRGAQYAVNELTRPVRQISLTMRVSGGEEDALSVRTSRPVDKSAVTEIARAVRKTTVFAPVNTGDTVIENVCGSGADIIATRSVRRKCE